MSTARLLWVERRAATTTGVAPTRPLVPFAALGGAVTAIAVLGSAALTGVAWGPVAATALVAIIGFTTASALLPRYHPHARLGGANIVTSVRLGMVAVLAGMLLAVAPSSIAIIAIAIVALSLDGVDGMLARRQGLSSRFGASFDME
ncbi:MAG: CDP-alcohol phosphatidyltransferase family protein, partial [Microcella sp.]